VHANFAELPRLQLSTFDVILADLGLSSPHLDDPTRGFSFRHDGPLDLRLDASRGEPASALLAKVEQEALTLALQRYGELRYAPKLAQILIAKPPTTTTELRARVVDWSGWRAPQLLPQVFQALRIWVNDELRALDTLLAWLPTGLNPGGRAACISFHSLEDRRVKHVLRDLSAPPIDPLTGKRGYAPFTLLTKHAIRPNDDEVKTNPRSRSALLRGIMKSS
jgi:16S rRNA (cytosine1402-N4)-methyltransferase